MKVSSHLVNYLHSNYYYAFLLQGLALLSSFPAHLYSPSQVIHLIHPAAQLAICSPVFKLHIYGSPKCRYIA